MVDSNKITATDGRMRTVFDTVVNSSIKNYGVEEKIKEAVDKTSVRTGVVTKFYPYLDKFEVKLDKNNKKVLCKRLHIFGGDLLDLYTPLGESKKFNQKLKEPYYVPRYKLHCVILNINDEDSNEHLILGFYSNKEIVGINPARPGNLKLVYLNDLNLFWIKFGRDGLDLRLPSNTKIKVGGLDENMRDVNYAKYDDVYSKEEMDVIINKYEERIKKLEEIIENNVDETVDENVDNDGG